MMYCGEIKQSEAVTICIGQLFDFSDSKTPLYQALGYAFIPADLAKISCTITKGITQNDLPLTLIADQVERLFILCPDSLGKLSLTAADTDTVGKLILTFDNATEGSEIIFPCSFWFNVLPAISYAEKYEGLCDCYVDITTVPFQQVWHKKGDMSVEYARKNLLDITGNNITSIIQIPGQIKEPTV